MNDPTDGAPSLPTALPHLDLRTTGVGPRRVEQVVVRTSALQSGIRTHTCPQCGMNPTTAFVKRTFQYIPPWVYAGLLLNVLVLMVLYFSGRRVVKAELGLCTECDKADRRGRTLQSMSVLGVLCFPMLFGFGLGAVGGVELGLFGAAAGIVSGIAGMVAAHRATRFDVMRCVGVDKKLGTTTLKASVSFKRVLELQAASALAQPDDGQAGAAGPGQRARQRHPGGDSER